MVIINGIKKCQSLTCYHTSTAIFKEEQKYLLIKGFYVLDNLGDYFGNELII